MLGSSARATHSMRDFLRNGKLLTLMLGHLTVDSYVGVLPILYPLLIGRFHLSLATVGLVSLAYGGTAAISQPLFGVIADRYGTRLTGVALGWTALTFSLAGFVPSFPLLLVLACASGLGSGAFHPLGALDVRALLPERRRSVGMSVYVTAGTVGVALGPLIGILVFGLLGIQGTILLVIPGIAGGAYLLWRMRGSAGAAAARKTSGGAAGAAGAAGAFSMLLAACGSSSSKKTTSTAAAAPAATPAHKTAGPKGDLAILNYALTLEYLEAEFYKEVLASGVIKDAKIGALAKKFGDTERQHVVVLQDTIRKLGGTPVAQPKTNFGVVINGGPKKILTTAATVENVGAAAYLGQAPRIRSKEILAAALSIHSVEARHAAALNELIGAGFKGSGPLSGSLPDGGFAKPLSMAEVLPLVKPFIAG